MRTRISKRSVDALQPGQSISDVEVQGFRARRLPSGSVAYEFRYSRRNGRRAFLALGRHGAITPDQARALARKRMGEIAAEQDPAGERQAAKAAAANSVNVVLDEFLNRHVRKRGLRTAAAIERTFERLIRPRIGTRSIYDLGRRDIVALLDAVEDSSGPVAADKTLALLRKALNWQAARDDLFNTPIVPGMSRTRPRERARTRILDDQEIRDLWHTLDALDHAPACYSDFVRCLLLTGQRRSDVSDMARAEITGARWTIPAGRYKTKADHEIPLTQAVLRLVGARDGFIFSSDGGCRPFSGFSKGKRALDRRITELRRRDGRKPMPRWGYHDLRRTARSLMARAGVASDVAERVLGHAIPGVRGTYDRHRYEEEKRGALERLAALVAHILHSAEDTVVAFSPRAAIT